MNEMLAAIRAVHAGRKALSAEVSFDLAEHSAQEALSPLEVRVLRLIANGHTNKEIAAKLSATEEAVKSQVRNILEAGHGRPHACSCDWTQARDHRAVGIIGLHQRASHGRGTRSRGCRDPRRRLTVPV